MITMHSVLLTILSSLNSLLLPILVVFTECANRFYSEHHGLYYNLRVSSELSDSMSLVVQLFFSSLDEGSRRFRGFDSLIHNSFDILKTEFDSFD